MEIESSIQSTICPFPLIPSKDVVILISSSGMSSNLVNTMKQENCMTKSTVCLMGLTKIMICKF